MRLKQRRPRCARPELYTFDCVTKFLLAKDWEGLRRMATPLVQMALENAGKYGIVNRPSEGKGVGKFCSSSIPAAGEVVAVMFGRVAADGAGARVLRLPPVRARPYVLVGTGPPRSAHPIWSGLVAAQYARIDAADINHSCQDANCAFVRVHDDDARLNAVAVKTLRAIEAGEELLVDYGDEYFAAAGDLPCCCRPVCPKQRRF